VAEVLIETEANNIYENRVHNYVRDCIAKGKFFIPNEKAKDLFSFLDSLRVVDLLPQE
jgi:hypothetical protein